MQTTHAELRYFAYGTLQHGFPNWEELADRLGDPVGRFRTEEPHALVVPTEPGCVNPGCGLLHRMAALVPGVEGFHVEGDLFTIDRTALAVIDRLENYDEDRERSGPYVRARLRVVSLTGGQLRDALAYRVRDPGVWRSLAASGKAELLTRYDRGLASATPKRCCIGNPGHDGPHDVLDLFGAPSGTTDIPSSS
jgi:gamma-glutamylcyclotransferase (GGCT)/AIG2-like uncharacterized protein YtfP